MKPMKTHDRFLPSRFKAVLFLVVSLALSSGLVSACGTTELDESGGETHFLIRCESDDTCTAVSADLQCTDGYCRPILDAAAIVDDGGGTSVGSTPPDEVPSNDPDDAMTPDPNTPGNDNNPPGNQDPPDSNPDSDPPDADLVDPDPDNNTPDPVGPNVSSPGCTSNTECGTCQICEPPTDAGPRTCIPAPENTPCATDSNSCTLDVCSGAPLHCVHQPIEGCDATCNEAPLIIADAVASSSSGGNQASQAIDKNTGTRWESVHGTSADPSWIYFDLGFDVDLRGISIDWEAASAKNYTIQVAPDGTCTGSGPGCLSTDDPWAVVYTSPTYSLGQNQRIDPVGLNTTGRYVRIHGTTRMTMYGYSIYEVKLFGSTQPNCECSNHFLHPLSATASTIESVNYPASEAIDGITGDSGNRWSSAGDGTAVPQWLYLDLGSNRYIDRVQIDFVTTNAWSKDYTLSIASDGASGLDTDAPWTTIYTHEGVNGTDPRNHDLHANSSPALTPSVGRYLRFKSTLHNLTNVSFYEFRAFGNDANFDAEECACWPKTLARSAAVASSVNGANTAAGAIDNSTSTRWETAHGVDPQWIYVDLGANKYIEEVVLDWESASAKNYTLSVAVDGAASLNTDAPWTVVYTSPTHTTNPNHRIDSISGLGVVGRYVRMHGAVRMTMYGYSLWNFSVLGSSDVSCGADADAGDAGADAGD